jgi:hypothetical protein
MGALLPGVEFKLELSLGLGDGASVVYLYDDPTSLYDTATYSGLELYWIDVNARFLSVECSRGRDTYSDRFQPGSLTCVLSDEDGLFNPDTGAIQIGTQQLRVGKWVRLSGRKDAASEWVPLWTGPIQAMRESFTAGGAYVTMTLQANDFGSQLGRRNPPALPAPVGDGERPGDRFTRVLTDTGWPDLEGWIDADLGTIQMQETTEAVSRQELLQQCAEAEGGAYFWSAAGVPTFRDRNWLNTEATWLAGFLGADVQVTNLPSLSWEAANVRNDVQISRVGGNAQRVISSASQSRYGQRTYRRLDLHMKFDGQAYSLAEQLVEFYQWDVARFSEIELSPVTADGVQQLLELELGQKIVLQVRTLRDWVYTAEVWVQRIRHSINADDWRCLVTVENADRSDPGTGGPYSDAYSDAYSPEGATP